MLSLTTINRWLKYAEICSYLAADSNAKNGALGNGLLLTDARIPVLLRLLYSVVDKQKGLYLGTKNFEVVAQYMYTLCGKYLPDAQTIITNASGGLVELPDGTPVNFAYVVTQIQVDGSGSPMVAGQTVLVITGGPLAPNSLSITADGIELPLNLNDRYSYSFTSNSTTITITFNQPAYTQQLFIIKYIKFI